MLLHTFEQAIEDAQRYGKRHLLLGNGFSIACRPKIFTYGRLYEQADFSSISTTAKLAFDALATQDFERVIKALRDAAQLIESYGGSLDLVAQLRGTPTVCELLVQTIAASHPAWPGEIEEEEYESCRRFLSNFDTVYTFNYDLLLYWTQMHTAEGEPRVPTMDFARRWMTSMPHMLCGNPVKATSRTCGFAWSTSCLRLRNRD